MEESEFLKLCAEAIDEGRAHSDSAMYETVGKLCDDFYSAKEASNDEMAISKLPRQSSACG
jgi:hypothetical protein